MRYVFNLGVTDSVEPQWPKGGNEKGLPRNTVVTGIKKLFLENVKQRINILQ